MSVKKVFLLFLPSLLLLVACDRIVEDPIGDEKARLFAWFEVNHLTPDSISSDGVNYMYYITTNEGTDLTPADSNYIVYTCTSKNLDDYVYETTEENIATLNDIYSTTSHYVPNFAQFLSSSSKTNGLSKGISMMKEGGITKLIVPSYFGQNGSSSTTVYDVELIKVVPEPLEYENDTLLNYLALNPGFTSFNDSLYYMKTSEGTRTCIVDNDSIVTVNYTGKFLDGFVFDTNIDSVAVANDIYSSSKTYEPMEFTVGSTSYIAGFSLAVKKMIEGEKATFIIPSFNAYGAVGSSGSSTIILPYTTLIFEIELVTVTEGTTTSK